MPYFFVTLENISRALLVETLSMFSCEFAELGT